MRRHTRSLVLAMGKSTIVNVIKQIEHTLGKFFNATCFQNGIILSRLMLG